MKRIIFTLMFLAMLFSIDAYAASENLTYRDAGGEVTVTQKITISADEGPTEVSKALCGGFFFSVSIKTSVDEAVTLTVLGIDGEPLYSTTTTAAATTGEIKNPTGYWPMDCTSSTRPTFTLSDMSSGNAIIKFTVAK